MNYLHCCDCLVETVESDKIVDDQLRQMTLFACQYFP